MVHQQAVQDQLQSEQKTLKKLKKTFLIRNQKVKAKRKMTLDLIFLVEQLINNVKNCNSGLGGHSNPEHGLLNSAATPIHVYPFRLDANLKLSFVENVKIVPAVM